MTSNRFSDAGLGANEPPPGGELVFKNSKVGITLELQNGISGMIITEEGEEGTLDA